MECGRAFALLRGLDAGAWTEPGGEPIDLRVAAAEIEEALKLGLFVEAFPEQIALVTLAAKLREEFAEFFHDVEDRLSPSAFRDALTDVEQRLRNDWYRLRSSHHKLAEDEGHRRDLRRLLGALADSERAAGLHRVLSESRFVAPGARYMPYAPLGAEHYALTQRGRLVRDALGPRLERFASQELAVFLKRLDKAHGKAQAFSREIDALARGVGAVRKNRVQLVVGLAKAGLPVEDALQSYATALRDNPPDVAVLCTRNAATFGGVAVARDRLQQAYFALIQAGCHATPVVFGAAKSLLAFERPEDGAERFVLLVAAMRRIGFPQDLRYKAAARLMPAAGSPSELGARVLFIAEKMGSPPSSTSVALAAMVRTLEDVDPALQRYEALIDELASTRLCLYPAMLGDLALECMACPGTPHEVVAIVQSLVRRMDRSLEPSEAVTVAAAFAKRFAF